MTERAVEWCVALDPGLHRAGVSHGRGELRGYGGAREGQAGETELASGLSLIVGRMDSTAR